MSKKDIEAIVEGIFDCISAALARDERVEIRGLGSFTLRIRRAKEGRNPKTGENIHIPEKRIPFFKASEKLKERVDSGSRKPVK